jgi:hypothetical protein
VKWLSARSGLLTYEEDADGTDLSVLIAMIKVKFSLCLIN